MNVKKNQTETKLKARLLLVLALVTTLLLPIFNIGNKSYADTKSSVVSGGNTGSETNVKSSEEGTKDEFDLGISMDENGKISTDKGVEDVDKYVFDKGKRIVRIVYIVTFFALIIGLLIACILFAKAGDNPNKRTEARNAILTVFISAGILGAGETIIFAIMGFFKS